MKCVPLTLKVANEFVAQFHRHHGKVQGYKFAIGAECDGELVGCSIVGRPVSRNLDDGETVEVTRLCTDGTKNACSFLYARSARIAKEMGYKKIITYILEDEDGTSLKASGWVLEDDASGGGTWDRPGRHRVVIDGQMSLFEQGQKYSTCKKKRYGKKL